MPQAQDNDSTTHTTEAGYRWQFVMGSATDEWVRLADRKRIGPHIGETNTIALENFDIERPVNLLVLMGKALGLKGELMLSSNGSIHMLHHDGEPVRLFAADDAFVKLPITVVPALLDDDARNYPDVLKALLAAVLKGVPHG